MTRDTINMLSACYAPSTDCVWAWLRAMHEQGFELRGSTVCDVVFYTPDQCIIPAVKEGVPVWIPMRSQPGSREVLYKTVKGSRLHFPDPVAAAIWWGVERTNGAPEIEPLSPGDVMLKMPSFPPPAPQFPPPFPPPPFPPPWVAGDVVTNQPPAVGWVDANQPPPTPWGSTSQAPAVSATARSQPGKGPTA